MFLMIVLPILILVLLFAAFMYIAAWANYKGTIIAGIVVLILLIVLTVLLATGMWPTLMHGDPWPYHWMR